MLSKLFYKIAKNFTFLGDKTFLKIVYRNKFGVDLNLEDPKTFCEKIHWYKLNYRNQLLKKLVDKYEVRDYVREKVGEKYLNELIGVYDTFEEINFDALPDSFVIKCVHGSGYNILVKDKSELDLIHTKKVIKKWQKKDFYKKGREWAYQGIPPKIIIEKYLEEINKPVINDYKIYCFDGKPTYIQVDIDRQINHSRCFYDTLWNKQNFTTVANHFYEGQIEKPVNLEEMTEVAEKLCKNIPFVRVDLYALEGKTIFGEMTFYPGDGKEIFTPDETNEILGDLFKLPAN